MDEARCRKELLRLFTTDDLRRFYGQTSSDGVTPIELLHRVTIRPRELKREILRRVSWERFGKCVLMVAAVAAVIGAAAAIIGAAPVVMAVIEGWRWSTGGVGGLNAG